MLTSTPNSFPLLSVPLRLLVEGKGREVAGEVEGGGRMKKWEACGGGSIYRLLAY
jgi:hypothetical protein